MLQTIKQHAAFHLLTFLSRNRDRWPRWIINTALFAAGIIVAGMWMSVTHPAAGEIWHNQLISVMLLCIACGALFFAGVIARGFYLSCIEITRDMPNTYGPIERVLLVAGLRVQFNAALPVSTWTPPDVGRDILICSLPGEGPEQFAARMDDAIEQANVARWVLVLQQGNPNGVIYGAPDAVSKFFRDWPPFQTENWLPEQRIVPAGTRFIGETETEFQDYVERFMLHFPEWSLRKKMSGEENRSGFVFQQIVRAASVALFLLFSAFAFAQKSAKVAETKIGNDVPLPGVSVSYIFAQSDLYRTGNGKDNYTELLKTVPGYRDSGGGALLAVMAGNKAIFKASQTGEVAERPATKAAIMRSHSETVEPERLDDKGFEMPDSVEIGEMADRAKYEILRMSRTAGQAAKPWWSVFMFGFWELASVGLILLMLAWIWAKVAAKEGYWTIHRRAKETLVVGSLIAASVLMVNIYLWAMAAGWPIEGLFVLVIFECAAAYGVLVWINPDFRPQKGNNPKPNSAWRNQNNPELPG